MLDPICNFGTFYITWFSVAVFCGAAAGSLLVLLLSYRKKASIEIALSTLALTLFLGLILSHILYALTKLISNLDSYDNVIGFLLNPAGGGFMYLGVFAGGAISCRVAGRMNAVRSSDLLRMLMPGLFLLLAIIRFAEPLDGLGKGPEAASTIFPLSFAPDTEYPEDTYIPAFFYGGLYALLLCFWSAASVLSKKPDRKTSLFFFVMYLSGQMFYEIFRRDVFANDTSIITFVRLGQLYSAVLLGVILVYAIIKARKDLQKKEIVLRCAVFAVSVGACVGLQFLFDKPLPLFGQSIWFSDWLVYTLLFLCAVGMGWAVLSVIKRMPKQVA